MSEVVKTTVTLEVLHLANDPLSPDLEYVLEEIDIGHAVGYETSRTTRDVPDDRVREELIAMGNDGDFFDDDLDDEEE